MHKLFGLLLALPLMALAEVPAKAAAPAVTPMATAGIGGQLVQLLFGLLLVIGLIFALAWVMRRVQQFGPRGGQSIKLVASQALGPRDRLLLVQVGGEQILLGISAGRITPLHVLKEPVLLSEAEPATPEFAQRLMELLGKDQQGPKDKDKT
ncbi:flagellar biosynthetic protein FliO [Aquipseudomonas guryensis]|jgi:flagellar protein FliO/FliZ|uniref:Flagellar protein n=1 Tax=Aquipseudomonas guryensis TaxID=2759165 RepID=A0A7W4DBT4_9GAMM|nr:flagellar biosynthetic protein FliO [Pseudomonas guryensis]MBB1519651.1 flagellar biosynthetic protein FliO [Pseudomonas guryensis]